MIDEPDSGLPAAGDGTAPPAAAGQQAFDAPGASAPLDSTVVSIKSGGKKGKGGGASLSSAVAGGSSSAPPHPPESAAAPISGTGGDAGTSTGDKKPQKVIDWGKYNHLLEHFALIYGTDTVWDGSERMIMKIANMGHAHGNDMVRMWKGSERRRTVRQADVVFDPTETCDPVACVNLYGGLAMEPKKGDVAPMLDLITYLTSRASDFEEDCDNIMHWMLCWLAYPLQNPGAKLRTSVVMHGDEGAGKNFLFDTVVAIYGKYGALVGQDELEDKFNDWRSCKLFVVGDEVSSRAELVHNKNRLKALITSPTVQINPKNMPRREESNHINIVFLSNELQPLALDNSDRRYLVVYTPRAKDFQYYRALGEWRANGGIAAFYDYLLHYNIADFEPYSPAPMTAAKEALIGLNRKSPEQFWWEWQAEELDLPYWSCSVDQTYRAYLKWCLRTGERYPFKREQFTPTVLRFAESQGKYARVKVMKPQTAGTKKAVRMFLITEPPADAQGQWATDGIALFEDHLKVYLGWSPRSPGSDDQGHGESS